MLPTIALTLSSQFFWMVSSATAFASSHALLSFFPVITVVLLAFSLGISLGSEYAPVMIIHIQYSSVGTNFTQFLIDIVHSEYVAATESLTFRVGIFREDSDVMGGRIGGALFAVTGRDIIGHGGSDSSCSDGGSGVGFRVGTLDTVCDLVIAWLLPRVGVRDGFGVFGISPGSGLLLDPALIYGIS